MRRVDPVALRQVTAVALGKQSADVVIEGGSLVNVYSGEIYAADVAIAGRRIAAVGDVAYTKGTETRVIDASGHYLTPGLIDTHSHVHESQLMITEYARGVLPRGTTGVCTDFYGELVVGGVDAVRACLDAAAGLPLKLFYMLGTPGYYQNFPFGHSGQPSLDEMYQMLDWPETIGMDDSFAARIAEGEEKIISLVDAVQARGLWVSSHGAELHGPKASAWKAYLRETDDHESVTADDAVERARLGIYVSVREGSACYNLWEVIKAVTERRMDPRRFCLCTDVPSCLEIADLGHIDHALRKAISAGVPPVTAVQMATLNAAEALKVDDDHGGISPGKVADILLVEDLAAFNVRRVIADGGLVAEDGRLLIDVGAPQFQEARGTIRFPRQLSADDFRIAADLGASRMSVRIIEASGDTVTTQESHEVLALRDGEVRADPSRGILKIAAIERVRGTGQIGLGLVRGFGLHEGALATTFNSQQQNMILVGTNDEDLALAGNELRKAGGGFVAVGGGQVRGLLPLPLFGLLSDQPFEEVVSRLRELNRTVAEMGCAMPAPYATLGFVGLPVDIGNLKICPEGLVDVWKRAVVDLQVVSPDPLHLSSG